jgi:hypothetical protein
MKIIITLAITLIFYTAMLAQSPPEIHYFQGELIDFQVAAKERKMPALLYLHGDNDAQQILYDRRTMSDTSLISMIDSALVPFQVNVAEHYNIALKYGIEDLPVLILFDKNGWEIDRLYGRHKPSEIIKFLKEIYQ